ncbi:hypothetical protein H072_7512 [Dactylellina haptotyla CBS 200.50]|uniref:SCP domain-containing protein n=1 Tax=Dactylellina haptotyla (strain CBS 200.50) TaxID=1284197 RepID=S8A771_DACHA|nr:hypothetical protein H072_7512 [Dactylellina haptotyla CBS 200.50]
MKSTLLLATLLASFGSLILATPLDIDLSRRAPAISGPFKPESEIQKVILDIHNELRAKHGVPPLTWSSAHAKFAQDNSPNCEAKHTAQTILHTASLGENYYKGGSEAAFPVASMTRRWYDDELKGYNFQNPNGISGHGHLTQILWKDTKEVGCAVRKCGQEIFLKCNYKPMGNYNTQIQSNLKAQVPPPLSGGQTPQTGSTTQQQPAPGYPRQDANGRTPTQQDPNSNRQYPNPQRSPSGSQQNGYLFQKGNYGGRTQLPVN